MTNYEKALTVGDVKKILEDFPDDMLVCKFSGYDRYGNYSMNFWNCDIELSYLKKEKSYIPHKGEIIYNLTNESVRSLWKSWNLPKYLLNYYNSDNRKVTFWDTIFYIRAKSSSDSKYFYNIHAAKNAIIYNDYEAFVKLPPIHDHIQLMTNYGRTKMLTYTIEKDYFDIFVPINDSDEMADWIINSFDSAKEKLGPVIWTSTHKKLIEFRKTINVKRDKNFNALLAKCGNIIDYTNMENPTQQDLFAKIGDKYKHAQDFLKAFIIKGDFENFKMVKRYFIGQPRHIIKWDKLISLCPEGNTELLNYLINQPEDISEEISNIQDNQFALRGCLDLSEPIDYDVVNSINDLEIDTFYHIWEYRNWDFWEISFKLIDSCRLASARFMMDILSTNCEDDPEKYAQLSLNVIRNPNTDVCFYVLTRCLKYCELDWNSLLSTQQLTLNHILLIRDLDYEYHDNFPNGVPDRWKFKRGF